jgi:hypothetical protein
VLISLPFFYSLRLLCTWRCGRHFGLRSQEIGTEKWKRRSIDERDKGGG